MRDLRAVARACFLAALEAVEPRRLVREALSDVVLAGSVPEAAVTVVAVGKAALRMAEGSVEALGDRIGRGLVIAPHGAGQPMPQGFELLLAGHPIPNDGSVRAARRVRDTVSELRGGQVLLFLLSGGGSSLISLPSGHLTVGDVQATTQRLLDVGAPIGELNTVRKHLDDLKGGSLARLARRARVLALVMSDVVGDRIDVIASGPLTPDPTSFEDAVDVLHRYGLWEQIPERVREHLLAGDQDSVEADPSVDDPVSRMIETRIIGTNRMAAEAACGEASRLGFESRVLTASLAGEAREVGRALARAGREVKISRNAGAPPVCLVAGGESTVTVRGAGKGGRNQELVLAAAAEIASCEDILVASFATDGIDGPTDAAGAWADGATITRARRNGLDALQALQSNDAYPFFAALDDLIVTGTTGTNVMDLALVFVGR